MLAETTSHLIHLGPGIEHGRSTETGPTPLRAGDGIEKGDLARAREGGGVGSESPNDGRRPPKRTGQQATSDRTQLRFPEQGSTRLPLEIITQGHQDLSERREQGPPGRLLA